MLVLNFGIVVEKRNTCMLIKVIIQLFKIIERSSVVLKFTHCNVYDLHAKYETPYDFFLSRLNIDFKFIKLTLNCYKMV